MFFRPCFHFCCLSMFSASATRGWYGSGSGFILTFSDDFEPVKSSSLLICFCLSDCFSSTGEIFCLNSFKNAFFFHLFLSMPPNSSLTCIWVAGLFWAQQCSNKLFLSYWKLKGKDKQTNKQKTRFHKKLDLRSTAVFQKNCLCPT